ncbi:MAG: tRNA 2-thiouridine(34) synthase MnmA [Flavobacteriaceae bacterium]|nr:tRNA 2-thiouridine(34) synthase MnmA [Flavobacteriaceae bacterium]
MVENKSTVVVGLSGGVDSSVAAYLLKKEGFNVIALFMKNWHDDEVTISDECPWLEDSNDALLVAEKLNIPFQTIDLSEVYKERIVNYMFDEYSNGRTPNPDVLCNREIKFDVFLSIALDLGADFVATGHYCQKGELSYGDKTLYQLKAGRDKNKDQSYFLCQLNQDQLSKVLFPIGHLQKSEVRAIAEREGLVTASKKDSQGLCFIGKVRLPDFLQQQLKPKKGTIIEIAATNPLYKLDEGHLSLAKRALAQVYTQDMGRLCGLHKGAHFFTIGQRKGLAVGGTKEPLFVIATDTVENIIYVGEGNKHPGLFRSALKIETNDIHWLRSDLSLNDEEQMTVSVRIRYRQPLQEATLIKKPDGLYIDFEQPQSAITSGQFAAWYTRDELLGSGVIS